MDLVEGEGKWADYQFKYKYIEKLEKFTGLLYLCKDVLT